jgi:hypothetical protein
LNLSLERDLGASRDGEKTRPLRQFGSKARENTGLRLTSGALGAEPAPVFFDFRTFP